MPSSALQDALARLVSGGSLDATSVAGAVGAIVGSGEDPAVVSAFLTALQMKGLAEEDLAGAAEAVRAVMTPFAVPDRLRPILDTCGTGGDGANTVNVSTATALVLAASGVRVAKHGNRSASGNSGSAEVLIELGVSIEADSNRLLRALEEVGITFLFAPRFHPALRGLAPIRKALPFRTVFNLLGPLLNPSDPDAQVVGAPGRERAALIAGVLRRTSRPGFRAIVVAGSDGLDEVTLAGPTHGFEVDRGDVREFVWTPEDFGLEPSDARELKIAGPAESAGRIRRMLQGEPGAVRDVVLANAAVGLMVMHEAGSPADGVARAAEVIDRGDAARLLDRWASLDPSED